MTYQKIRSGLYIERLTLALAYGQFLVLPLFFKSQGFNEAFFGQVYAVGTIGTILSIALSASMIRRFGLNRIAPVGSFVYAFGSLLYFLASLHGNVSGYYIASLFHGIGWGIAFTMGPICVSTTTTPEDRAYYFSMYAIFTTIGVGIGPLIDKGLTQYVHLDSKMIFMLATVLATIAFLVSFSVARNNAIYQKLTLRKTTWLAEFKEVMQQKSIYFFLMGAFGACILTTLLNLQTTFAADRRIDHNVFYIFYTASVALSRVFLSKSLSQKAPQKTIVNLVLIMIAGLFLMFWADKGFLFYAGAALLLGAGYGLLFPIVQAEAANHAPSHLQAPVIVYFNLYFFLANYLFPYAGGLIAVHYGYDALLCVLIVAGLGELLTAVGFYKLLLQRKIARYY